MKNVKMKVSELLEIVKKNREEHRALFLKAQEGYRKKVIEELEKRLADAREDRKIDVMFRLPEPADHTSDYDRTIRMLEMCVEDTVEVGDMEFECFVMDNWDWKRAFLTTNSQYVGEA